MSNLVIQDIQREIANMRQALQERQTLANKVRDKHLKHAEKLLADPKASEGYRLRRATAILQEVTESLEEQPQKAGKHGN